MWPWLAPVYRGQQAAPARFTPPERSRAPAAPRRGRAAPRSASCDVGLGVATLEVGEEHVAAEALLARPRLDPGEVDLPVGELRQAADQPARRLRADAPEHDRGLPRPEQRLGVAGAARRRAAAAPATRTGSRCRRRPRPRPAAPGSRSARPPAAFPSAAHGPSCSATIRTASAVELPASTRAPRQPRADEARALRGRLGVRDDRLDLGELELGPRDQAVADRVDDLADDRRRPRSPSPARRAWR